MAVCNILQEDYADGYQTPPARLKFDPFETCETCDACQGTGDAGADRDCRVCGGRGWRDDAPFPDEQRAEVFSDDVPVEQIEADMYRIWAQLAPKEQS